MVKMLIHVGYVPEDGSLPCPTGLPTVYLYDGKTLETICGEEVFEYF